MHGASSPNWKVAVWTAVLHLNKKASVSKLFDVLGELDVLSQLLCKPYFKISPVYEQRRCVVAADGLVGSRGHRCCR